MAFLLFLLCRSLTDRTNSSCPLPSPFANRASLVASTLARYITPSFPLSTFHDFPSYTIHTPLSASYLAIRLK